ncbi:MAG: hypothetical protein EXS14_09700 [Planctomycetes bacterium]|nr:hypothetical protein [Planctomycetota bacterium]
MSRSRDILLMVLLFAATFAASIWLLAGDSFSVNLGDGAAKHSDDRADPNFGGRINAHAPGGTGTDADSAAAKARAQAGDASVAATSGTLAAALSADVGLIGTVNATLSPVAGRLVDNRSGSFQILDIPPGSYKLSVWADGFIPSRERMVTIETGRKHHIELQLTAGVRPKGRSIDAETSQPVAGATIDFIGVVRVLSDHNGEFETPWAIPAAALESMVISHPEYDTISLARHPWGDVRNMQVGLGRGPCALIGRITQVGPRTLPQQGRIRAYMTSPNSDRELRRQINIDTTKDFSIARMTPGAYAVVLDFPGTNLPARTEEVHLGSAQPMEVVFPFGGGTKLEGTLLTRGGTLHPTRVELIGEDGRSVLEVSSATGGVFLMEAAPAGRWRLRVHYGNPHFNTEHFEIDEALAVVLLEVDCDAQRLKR